MPVRRILTIYMPYSLRTAITHLSIALGLSQARVVEMILRQALDELISMPHSADRRAFFAALSRDELRHPCQYRVDGDVVDALLPYWDGVAADRSQAFAALLARAVANQTALLPQFDFSLAPGAE